MKEGWSGMYVVVCNFKTEHSTVGRWPVELVFIKSIRCKAKTKSN